MPEFDKVTKMVSILAVLTTNTVGSVCTLRLVALEFLYC